MLMYIICGLAWPMWAEEVRQVPQGLWNFD